MRLLREKKVLGENRGGINLPYRKIKNLGIGIKIHIYLSLPTIKSFKL